MAQQNRSTLKNWFRTGLKPVQEQFWDWIDSFWHKDDQIPTSSIDGLDATLTDLLNTVTNPETAGANAVIEEYLTRQVRERFVITAATAGNSITLSFVPDLRQITVYRNATINFTYPTTGDVVATDNSAVLQFRYRDLVDGDVIDVAYIKKQS